MAAVPSTNPQYTPLTLPTMGAAADYAATANFLASSAKNLVDSGNSFLQTLSALKDTDFSQAGNLPEFDSVVWDGNANLSFVRPARTALGIDAADLLARLNQLVPPVAPTTTFDYVEPGYSSALRQPVIEKLLTDLVNGGYGIDTADEVALFNRARDREAQLTQANVDEVRRQSAATGFPLPQGSMYALIQKALQEQQARLSGVNRDIALERSKLYVENRRKVIDQIMQSEEQSISLYNAIQARTIQVGNLKVQLALSLFEAGIKLFNERLMILKTSADIQQAAAQAIASIYNTDVQAYAAFVNAVVSGAQVDIANSRNKLTRDIAAHQSRVDIVKFKLQQLAMTTDNSRSINQFAVEFFRTALGASMNGITGLAVQNKDIS